MKLSIVQQLLGQGFTAEQILAMEDDTEQQAAPEQDAPEPPAPEQAAQEQEVPDKADHPEQVPSWASALEASIAALTKTMQGYNRLHDEQPDDPVNELDKALETYITGKAPAKGGKK